MNNITRFHDYAEKNIISIVERIGFPKTTIELGVFQGHTTFGMTEFCYEHDKEYTHYAIDSFITSPDLNEDIIKESFDKFTRYLDSFKYSSRIVFMKMDSNKALLELINKGISADFVYIDANHTSKNVLEDLVLSWQILNKGGVILCDDSGGSWMHKDINNFKATNMSPRLAVENFIQCFWNEIEILDLQSNWQTAIRKS